LNRSTAIQHPEAVIIGAGPAGLMAAEHLASEGYQVSVYEAMPSVGRKFMRAGVGGLNLTHSEPFSDFCARYSSTDIVSSWLRSFDPQALQEWAAGLGIACFTGSSGKVFPVQMKASPLLRSWLHRLHQLGVEINTRQRWVGWHSDEDGRVLQRFENDAGEYSLQAKVTVLAMGGGSWSRLGSDGRWVDLLKREGITCNLLKPVNCGFDYAWSPYLRSHFAGAPLKSVCLSVDAGGERFDRFGEALISGHGIQGNLIYHASKLLREQIEHAGEVRIFWDLLPGMSLEMIVAALARPRGKNSLSNHLRKQLGLTGVKVALLHELAPQSGGSYLELAEKIKSLPQLLRSARPLDEAISTAGGVCLSELDEYLMLRRQPGIFCAGEMLDWEAPTGGYLLNASFASGLRAGQGAVAWLKKNESA
jgi:uncharacterized flavoprotein (TIGR03862 family)